MLMTFAGKHAGIRFGDYCRSGERMAAAQLSVWRDFDLDILLTCSAPALEVVDLCGEASARWYPDQLPAIDEAHAALKDKALLARLGLPDVHAGRMGDRIEAIRILGREAGPEGCVVGWVEGPLALAAELRGINALMTDFYDAPEFVHDLLAFCAVLSARYAEAQVDAGADSIGMSGAAASLIGPDFYRDFVCSQQQQILRSIVSAEAMARVHMCGCTDALLQDMARLSADVFEVDFLTDLSLARQRLGAERTLCGNVDTISTMLEGDVGDVAEAARNCQATGGDRFIVAPGCEVAPFTPATNVHALVDFSKSLS
jgi:MtaA/CmuA family methyltransferase